MNNKEFLDHIMAVDDHIRELYTIMIELLNQPDLDYKIEFPDETFDFFPPMTQEEKDEMDIQKSRVVLLLMQNALIDTITSLRTGTVPTDREYRRIWGTIASFQREYSKESTTSTISSSPYEIEDISTSKDLNYDSIYVKAQNRSLTDDDVIRLFLGVGNERINSPDGHPSV